MIENQDPQVAHLASQYATASKRFNNDIELSWKNDEDHTF